MQTNKLSIPLIATALVVGSGTADATNGYFRLGYSANSIAMGGASTASAQDAMAGASNPALALNIDTTYTAAISAFSPNRGFKVEGGGPAAPPEFGLMQQDTRSEQDLFFIPSFGYKRDLNENLALNVNLYANGGMNTDYDESVFYAGETGVDLQQAFLSSSIAYRLTDSTHLGFAPILGYQRFKAKGLGNFAVFSQDANALTDNGYAGATGYGARIGVWQNLNEHWSVGASYQSEIKFEKFDKYSGLFAEGGSFNVPETYNLGIEFKRSTYTLAFDYQRINYSDIQSVGNPMMPALMGSALGQNNAAGFGWNDIDVFELGLAIEGANDDTYRFGVSYAEQPIPDSEVLFNILAPGVQEWHLTAGYEFGVDDVDYSFALMYSPSKEVKGRNPLLQSQTQEITLEMSQLELTFGVNF